MAEKVIAVVLIIMTLVSSLAIMARKIFFVTKTTIKVGSDEPYMACDNTYRL